MPADLLQVGEQQLSLVPLFRIQNWGLGKALHHEAAALAAFSIKRSFSPPL